MGRYQVSGLPPVASRGLSAFFPNMTRSAGSGAQQYKDGLTGWPGTPAIGITPQGTVNPDVTSLANKGTASSADAPWVICPGKYWALPERNYRPGLQIQMYDPVAPQNTTMIPVPAVSYRQYYQRHAAGLAAGIAPSSGRQVKWPPRLPKWPGGATGSGAGSGASAG